MIMAEWLDMKERNRLNRLYGLDPEHGRNLVLDNYMKDKRTNRIMLSPDKRYELYQNGDFIQLWFQTPACRFSLSGKCTICNYWNGRHIPGLVKEMINELSIPAHCHTLLINTCGSCLDPKEIFRDDLILLLKWLERCPAERIIFETHWTTLTRDTLALVSEILIDKKIFYEVGIESINSDSLFYMLNKPSSLTDISRIIERIHNYNAVCIMNVVLGLPFLNPDEQVADAVSTICELLDKNADYIVLFPINIKPHTLIMDLYERHQYSHVPIRLIAEILLKNFPDELDRINTAWFGDRFEEGVIPPASCEICRSQSIDLLKRYNAEDKTNVRSQILRQIVNIKCECENKFFSFKRTGNLCDRLIEYYGELENGSVNK